MLLKSPNGYEKYPFSTVPELFRAVAKLLRTSASLHMDSILKMTNIEFNKKNQVELPKQAIEADFTFVLHRDRNPCLSDIAFPNATAEENNPSTIFTASLPSAI
ncbi:hypothetical protein TNCV_1732441 [Trichonephila clavipes]|nr:hypothetical protein TNCV_1732441 [Trichonephila clavipes]